MRWQIAVLLVASMLAVPMEGQRAGGGIHGGGMPGGGLGFGGHHGFPGGPFRGNVGFRHFRNFGGFGAFWVPWDYPWDYSNYPLDDGWYDNRCGDLRQSNASNEGSAQDGVTSPVIVVRSDASPPAPSPEAPKVIDIPIDKESLQPKPQLPTVFVLTNGTRLEVRRYILTLNSLDIEAGQQHRTVPVSELDLQQTIAVNLQRGIEVKVPHSASELFLGF